MSLAKENVENLVISARNARENAYAPYSGFRVGAAVMCNSGKVYTGCNVENASYGLSMCAERVAIYKAVSDGEKHIEAIAIVTDTDEPASPCGACLQIIAEFSQGSDPEIITSNLNLEYETKRLSDYLPKPFYLRK